MIKSKSSILKSLGKWDYDEIKIPEPNQEQAIIKIISCGICSTDIVRSMKTGSRPPKHGILFQHKYVHSAPKRLRGKIARTFSSKIAIAVRIDYFKGKFDKDLITKLNDKVLQLLSKNNLKIT